MAALFVYHVTDTVRATAEGVTFQRVLDYKSLPLVPSITAS